MAGITPLCSPWIPLPGRFQIKSQPDTPIRVTLKKTFFSLACQAKGNLFLSFTKLYLKFWFYPKRLLLYCCKTIFRNPPLHSTVKDHINVHSRSFLSAAIALFLCWNTLADVTNQSLDDGIILSDIGSLVKESNRYVRQEKLEKISGRFTHKKLWMA